jgi:hypothetical protein
MDITAEALQALTDEDFARVLVMVDAEEWRRRASTPVGGVPGFVRARYALTEQTEGGKAIA